MNDVTVRDLYLFLNARAPFHTAEEYDNTGLLCGDMNQCVTRCLLSLDITEEIIDEAAGQGAELILTHHPVIFSPLSQLTASGTGRRVYLLIQKHISVISSHTNFDFAPGGVNDHLASLLNLSRVAPCAPQGDSYAARLGEISPLPFMQFAQILKKRLGCRALRATQSGRLIHRIAVCSGAGGDYLEAAAEAGADTFLTGEAKYHHFQRAKEMGITLIEAGHFETENPALFLLKESLVSAFSRVSFQIAVQNQNLSECIII